MSVSLKFWDFFTSNKRERQLRLMIQSRDMAQEAIEDNQKDIAKLKEHAEKWTEGDVAKRIAREEADIARLTNYLDACNACISALRDDLTQPQPSSPE